MKNYLISEAIGEALCQGTVPRHNESRLRRFLEGKWSNILKIYSKFYLKTTALSKKCSIFATLFLMKDEY